MKTKTSSRLWIVTGYKPRPFVARFVTVEGKVQAPTSRIAFMRDWTLEEVEDYVRMKRWSIRESKRD